MTIEFIEHPDYLEVVFRGERSLPGLLDCMNAAYERSQIDEYRRILLDIAEAKGTLKTFDRFRLGEEAAKLFNSTYRIVTLEKVEEITKLAENTAVNRGVSLLVIADRQVGLDWLLGEPKQERN